jgi:hypothetical protein
MWAYPGFNCPDHSSLKELSVVDVEARICKFLDSAATPSLGTGPDPYEGESLASGSVL